MFKGKVFTGRNATCDLLNFNLIKSFDFLANKYNPLSIPKLKIVKFNSNSKKSCR